MSDPLGPARGLLFGCLLSLAAWWVIALLVAVAAAVLLGAR